MKRSRTENAKRNVISGMLNKIITLLLPFISRTILIYALGAEYLGLNSLFSSILQVLSLAELGFSSAVVFSLYKPLAEDNRDAVCALLAFYRSIYRIVGLIIFGVGIAITPFLKILIHGDVPADINLYLLYLLYLLNTVISYFAYAYKSSLLTADQRQDIINNISTVLGILANILQIFVLLKYKNYYYYTGIIIVSTVCNNIWVAIITKKHYPEYVCAGELNQEERKRITTQIKGLAIGKFSKTARNSFDSIVLSMFCGLIDVSIYSNYYYIFSAIIGFITVLMTSISAGVGNSIATESKEKNYRDFKKIHFYVSWIGSWCTICLFCLYQPFMQLWVGNELMASNLVMVMFCVYFYITMIGQVRAIYSSAAGLWWEFRWLEIGEMIANLSLNFILGYYYGMKGILLATLITVFLFSVIGISNITFKYYFERKSMRYHMTNLIYATITVIVGLLTYTICGCIYVENSLMQLILIGFVCLIFPNLIFMLLSMANKRYKQYLLEIKAIIRGGKI